MKEWGFSNLDFFSGERRRRHFWFFVRPLKMLDGPVAAIQLSFIWMEEKWGPLTVEDMSTLAETLESGDATIDLMWRRMFNSMDQFKISDLGSARIDRLAARHVSYVVEGAYPRDYAHEVYLASVSPFEALCVEAEIDPEATEDERSVVLPRIIRSIRLSK